MRKPWTGILAATITGSVLAVIFTQILLAMYGR